MSTYFIFSANYLPNLGGVERYTYNLSKKLLEHGHHVVVITSNTNKIVEYEISEGIKIYRLPCLNFLGGRFPVLKYGRHLSKMIRELKELNPDYAIINTRFYIHSLFGVRLSKILTKKHIIIEHGTAHFTVNNRLWDVLGHLYEHLITFCVKHYCDDFYGVSAACNDWLEHFHIRPKGIFYNSIDIHQIQGLLEARSAETRVTYGIPENSFVITYAGRLVIEKGIMQLIAAVKALMKRHDNVYLFIAGDGDLRSYVQQTKNEHIRDLGKIDFSDVIGLLRQTDVFCLPTVYPEGFPTSVLEAAACQCYIITTTYGGSRELIIDHDYGTILDTNAEDRLFESLEYAYMNPEYRTKAAELSFARLTGNFTWDIVGAKIIETMSGAV